MKDYFRPMLNFLTLILIFIASFADAQNIEVSQAQSLSFDRVTMKLFTGDPKQEIKKQDSLRSKSSVSIFKNQDQTTNPKIHIRKMESLKKGTESGGGGTTILQNSEFVLLDFLQLDSNFTIPTNPQLGGPSRLDMNEKVISFDRTEESSVRKDNNAFHFALKIINQWIDLPFDLSGSTLSIAFHKPVIWNFTTDYLQAPYHLPQGISSQQTFQTAAYYLMNLQEYRVFVSIPIWNQMSLLSQAGLLIHEALRHIQIGFSAGFNEKALQQATALYSLCQPNLNLSQYAYFLIQNRSDLAEKVYGSFEDIVSKECKRNF